VSELDNGYIGNVPLEMETIEDSFGKSIVRHEYPHVDGAELEDMGQTARTVRVRCLFWDDDASHFTYDNHQALLRLLEATGASTLEFNHPQYGLLQGSVEQISVRHDDRERCAEIDFSFIEDGRQDVQPVAIVDLRQVETLFSADIDTADDTFSAEAIAAGSAEVLDVELDPEQSILDQFTAISTSAWAFVQEVDAAVRTIEGTLIDVANPANSLVATIAFTTNLPGRLLGSIARCVERYARLYDGVRNSPMRFIDSFRRGVLALEAAVPGFAPHIHAAGAARACIELAGIFGGDDTARRGNDAIGDSPAFDPRGNRLPTPQMLPVLTVADLEDSLALARTWVQESVDADRTRTELKAMARTLLDHVNGVKVDRENLISVMLDQPLPLHLVCLKYGLSYRQAERLQAINRFRRPNAVKGEVLVYA
jgi:prophage DNA circulation protein